MNIITDTETLARTCAEFATEPYVTVDTEFLRERTYWSQLCLIQMAKPGKDTRTAVVIDPLADDIDLTPFYELMADESVVKVFHAARQDVEIFYHQGNVIPTPLFDTQVAAMVCGYGEQVGYETLVRKIAQKQIDKSSRFTDWSRRPLNDKQLAYAVADVTHLRLVYDELNSQIEASGRGHWVTEEMGILTSPETYQLDPKQAWKRVKARSNSPKFLAVVQALAEWREETAQSRNVPRSRILKDDALLEIATAQPASPEGFARLRLAQREARKTETTNEILAVIKKGKSTPADQIARPAPQPQRKEGSAAIAKMLKVFLEARAEEIGVAPRLIAPASEIEALAGEDRTDLPVLKGWRREVFGEDALKIKAGEVALVARRKGVGLVNLPVQDAAE